MSIKIVSLNADSIVNFNRRNELFSLILAERVDICLVQETKLDSNIKFKLDGYNILRNDVVRGRSGTAIIVRNSFTIRNHTVYNTVFHSNSVEILFMGKWNKISSVYFPPGVTSNANDFDTFFANFSDSFMGGDFNGRHALYGDVSNNFYGCQLNRVVHNFGGEVLNPPSPTHYGSVHGSYIDKFINFTSISPSSTVSILPSFSDHSAITIIIPGSAPELNDIEQFNYDGVDIERFNKYLDMNIKRIVLPTHENLTSKRIDEIIGEFNAIIGVAIKRFVPGLKTHSGSRIILPAATRKLQAHCKRYQRKLFRNDHAPLHVKRQIINNIRLLRIMIKNSTASCTAEFFTKQFDNVKNTLDAHRVIKQFTGHKKRETMGGSIFLDASKNRAICGSSSIANELGRHFAANNNINTTNSEMTDIVERNMEILNSCVTNISFDGLITPVIMNVDELNAINQKLPSHQRGLLTHIGEVENIIGKRPNKKSTGNDGLPFTIIKQFSPLMHLFLTILFNQCLAISYFPEFWKSARVTAIPKPNKDSSVITNWRPISQLCCLSKIFEKLFPID